MGGSIRIIKKQKDEYRSYKGWTNNIPVFTWTNRFFKDEKWASDTIEKWGEEEKNPNFNRSEYGAIFIDFDKKRIYQCQGYSTIGQCHKSGIQLALMDENNGYEHALTGSRQFIEDGTLMYNTKTYSDKNGLIDSKSRYIVNEEELISIINALYNKKKKSASHSKLLGSSFIWVNDDFSVDASKYDWEIHSWNDSEPFSFFTKIINDYSDDIINMTDFETWDDDSTLRSKLISSIRDKKLNIIINDEDK